MNLFNIYITEDYSDKTTGEDKTNFTKVGTGFPHQDGKGMNIVIPEGIALSGRLLVRERKANEDKPDGKAADAFNEG